MGNFSKAILIASVALCLYLPAFSQNISLKISDITVKDAIEQLKEKTGYAFVFSSADVDTNKRVSIMANEEDINNVIKQILHGQNDLSYEIKGKKIIIKKIQPVDLIQKIYNPQIQISAESGTKRSIFRQKNKTKRSKKRLHTTLIKPEQKVNEDLCSGFIVS